jgi:arsenate reductase (thioredoxin)
MNSSPPEILFVCVHNAGRSQMAAALLRHHGHGRVLVTSAGSEPANDVNPVAVEALREVGIEIGGALPRQLETEAVQVADVVVTMGCGDACPVYPGKRYEDWDVEDPAGRDLEAVRRIRDDIDARVRALLETV